MFLPLRCFLPVALLLLAPLPAQAAFLEQKHADILWTLIASILVMFMQAGFAFVESGFCRAKNACNIILKNVLDFTLGAPLFFLVGFALMFGEDVGGGLLGFSGFALSGVNAETLDGQWTLVFVFYQMVFAATAATIVSGAIAERTHFKAYLFMTMFVSAFIYPVSGHWCWGGAWLGTDAAGGWLQRMGFIDFAGSTVVHAVGGAIALAGTWIMGPRLGKYGEHGKVNAIPGHNIPLAALGVFILWFAWFGFNAGSTTAVVGGIGAIALNTNLAACTGCLAALCTSWIRFGKPDPSMCLNGVLAGLVAVTAGCNEVAPMGALCIGFIAGILVVISVEYFDKTLRIDDPVGAVSVHGVCGAFGTIAVGFFAAPGYGGPEEGLLYGGTPALLLVQTLGTLACLAWAFGMGVAVFTLADRLLRLRALPEEELKGLDFTEHGSEAYSGFQIFTLE